MNESIWDKKVYSVNTPEEGGKVSLRQAFQVPPVSFNYKEERRE